MPICMRVVLLFALVSLASCGEEKPWRSLHLTTTSANTTHYSFQHGQDGGTSHLVVYSPADGALKVYRSSSGHLWAAALLAGDSFVVTEAPKINPPYSPAGLQSAVYRCGGDKPHCAALFSSPDGIGSKFASSDGGELLYAGSPLQVRTDPWTKKEILAYRDFDLFVFRNGQEPRKLTDVAAVSLNSVSAGGDLVAFEMLQANKRTDSLIYCARIGPNFALIDFASDTRTPCISHGTNYNSKPSLSPDGKRIAFLSSSRSSKEAGGWVYDIVIADLATKQPISVIPPSHSAAMSLSNPSFVNNDAVRFIERTGDRYTFKQFDVPTGSTADLGTLDVADILAAPAFQVGSPN